MLGEALQALGFCGEFLNLLIEVGYVLFGGGELGVGVGGNRVLDGRLVGGLGKTGLGFEELAIDVAEGFFRSGGFSLCG